VVPAAGTDHGGAAGKKAKPRPGSGIPARPIIRALVWARRVTQGFFLLLFLFLLYRTEFRGTFSAGATESVRMPYPVEVFLSADPFVALMTFLSTHTVYRGLAWSLTIVALTLLFGRVFCGWICPFGTLHHITAWIRPKSNGMKRVQANLTRGWQRIKYYLLFTLLAAAVTGSAIGGMLDPICVMVRSVGMTVMPAANYLAERAFGAVQETNVRALQDATDDLHGALQEVVLPYRQYNFHEGWIIAALFIAIVAMNRVIPRFWCRVLCPLGALLGWLSKFSLFGMEKDHAKCTDCNLCLVHCQGADSPQGGVKWRQDECHMCFNCEAACPEDVIEFRFLPQRGSRIAEAGLDRRTVLATVGAGAALLPMTRVADALDVNYDERLIRPPGSVEEREFLERCIRCAECMKVCPNNALHPALFEGGIEGLWTPMFIMRIGYCEPSCVLCGDVCPTGAIQKITEKQKLGIGQPPIRIGTAFYDIGRCLPWAMETPCIVCEEFCPTSPKAIWVEEVDRVNRVGDRVHLQRPHVDPQLCIGCGACEKVCPVQDEPAVYVTSIGETRSRTNVILLENTSYNQT
jgi:polyferredoxin